MTMRHAFALAAGSLLVAACGTASAPVDGSGSGGTASASSASPSSGPSAPISSPVSSPSTPPSTPPSVPDSGAHPSSSRPHASASHSPSGPGCPAPASGSIAGKRAQSIWFADPGTAHQWPDGSVLLHACASSGLPVSFRLVGTAVNCALVGPRASVLGVPTDCTLEASQGGSATFAAAPAVTRRYHVDWQHVVVTYSAPRSASLAHRSAAVQVGYSSSAPIGLGGVEIDTQTPTVCDGNTAEAPASGGNRYTMTVALALHATGLCSFAVNAGSSQFALGYPEDATHSFLVGP